MSAQSDDTLWSSIFAEQIRGIETSEYILSRALPRPRDVLGLCQAAIDEAQKNGHDRVTAQDVLDGERANANDFMRSLETEFASSYPNLRTIVNVFSGMNSALGWEEFINFADGAIQEHADLLATWEGEAHGSPKWLAAALYEIGMVGLAEASQNDALYRDDQSFDESWASWLS